MAAALAAHAAGAQVVVVEAQDPASHTPNVRMSGGAVMTASDAPGMTRYLLNCAGGLVDDATCEAWAERAVHLDRWLGERDVEMDDDPRGAEQPHLDGATSVRTFTACTSLPAEFPGAGGLTVAGGRVKGGEAVYRGLRTALRRVGIEVLWNARPLRLTLDRDNESPGVTGVVLASGETRWRLVAKRGVVLATGGFGADPNFVRQFIGVPAKFYGNPGNRGGGLRLAMSVGADLVRMNRMVGRGVMSFVDARGVELGFMLDMNGGGYVIVDQRGQRYANEYEQAMLSHSFYYHMLQFDRERVAYVRSPSYYIFDERRRRAGPLAFNKFGAGAVGLYRWSEDNGKEIDSRWIGSGATAGEAALQGGLAPESAAELDATVAHYNASCGSRADAFGRPADSLVPLDMPPFHCVPLYAGGPYPQGGPRRDALGRVMSLDGAPIPGLFAAGELGQAIGALYPAPGAAISEAICLGQVAGEAAAIA
jgi:succinate dehydrogenase/fumarate reductase flavoprotein subunit